MEKFYGLKKDFTLAREEYSRFVFSFDKEDIDGVHITWYEIPYNIKQTPRVDIQTLKGDYVKGVNEQTDKEILTGFTWNDQSVYLSTENQFNFKAAYDLAVQTNGATLPVTFKIGEDENGEPVYHTFTELSDLQELYISAIQFITQCLEKGWQRKDSVDWEAYHEALDKLKEDSDEA